MGITFSHAQILSLSLSLSLSRCTSSCDEDDVGEVVLCSEDGSMEDRREEVGGGGRERGEGGSKALTPPVWDTGERESLQVVESC